MRFLVSWVRLNKSKIVTVVFDRIEELPDIERKKDAVRQRLTEGISDVANVTLYHVCILTILRRSMTNKRTTFVLS